MHAFLRPASRLQTVTESSPATHDTFAHCHTAVCACMGTRTNTDTHIDRHTHTGCKHLRVRGQLLAGVGVGRRRNRRKPRISLEVQVLEGKVRLHDAGGLYPGPQDILLRGDVGCLGYPVQVIQVAEGGRKRRI